MAAAKSLLAGDLGVVEAARQISRYQHTVDPDMRDKDLLYFVGIDSESDRLVFGRALQEWQPSLHDAKRQEFADFETFYRPGALRDAAVLIERYSRPPNER